MAKLKGVDWNELTRPIITQIVMSCKDLIINQPLSPVDAYKLLSTHIKQYLPITFKKQYNKETLRGHVFIGGAYHSDIDEANNRAIKLVFQFHPDDNTITIPLYRFRKIARLIADTILHEIIHMHQYRGRQFKELPAYNSTANNDAKRADQRYLGNTDEIGAYSFNIACELSTKFKNDEEKIVEYLNLHQTLTPTARNSNWQKYLVAFDNNHNHKIIKRVKKRVMYYLPFAKAGKPFKNTNRLKQN